MSKKNKALKIDIGISEKDRKGVAEGLNALLADTYALYQKTHAFHWNVVGPMFQTLHLMFEVHYNELWLATDLIAERIRALGFPVRATYSELAELSSIEETRRISFCKRCDSCFNNSSPATCPQVSFTILN